MNNYSSILARVLLWAHLQYSLEGWGEAFIRRTAPVCNIKLNQLRRRWLNGVRHTFEYSAASARVCCSVYILAVVIRTQSS